MTFYGEGKYPIIRIYSGGTMGIALYSKQTSENLLKTVFDDNSRTIFSLSQ